MQLKTFVVGPLQSNVYIFYCDVKKSAVCFDAGDECERILDFLNDNELDLKYIILTHGHFDHIGAAEELREKTGAKILIHSEDVELIMDPMLNGSGHYKMPDLSFKQDATLAEGDTIEALDNTMKIYHTPGHTRGCICIEFGEYLITGDTLFKGSIGRTDLYGGSMKTMYYSLKKFSKMNKKLIVLPGHGPKSTIGEELNHNPYLRRVR